MRTILAILLILHGLVHLLGVAHAFEPTSVPQLHGKTLVSLSPAPSRAIGVLWLTACLLLVAAALLLLWQARSWWWLGASGVVLSQVLVVYAWPAAKAGTGINLVLAVAVVIGAADARFQAATDAAVRTLFAGVEPAPAAPVTEAELAPLPAPVQRWLTASGIVGKPRVRAVRLRQRGRLRTAPDQAFMPAEAHQYFDAVEPGFVWRVRARMLRFLPIAGRDAYLGGEGRMRIQVASLVRVVNASGAAIDQGSLLRYLGEIIWFPSAALSPYIHWEAIDANRARATMSYRGVTASAVFSFDEHGRFLELEARRFMGGGKDAKLERWVARAREWRERSGVVIPVTGEVIWKLERGDFRYFEWEIVEIEYDRPELYP